MFDHDRSEIIFIATKYTKGTLRSTSHVVRV